MSEIDRRVEALIRQRLAKHFADHGIIGEELAERPGQDSDFVWVIDPIDGMTDFVNGFPLFAASIGVHAQLANSGALGILTSFAQQVIIRM